MKVSSDSWHYKILMTEHQQMVRSGTSLCVYFWMVVLASIIWTFAIVAAIGIIAAIGVSVYMMFYVWYFMIADLFFGVQSFDIEAIELSIILHIFFFVGWIISVCLRIKNKIKNQERNQPNLVIEYARAKKNRICPLIEFEE